MASGQGPIYDDSVTFPTNKTDGGQPSTPHTFAAVDANNQGSFDYAARTAIRSGIYHGALDQSASLPPLSSATPGAKSTHWTSNGGQLSASEEGGPYIWIHNTNYINLGDKRFGAVPDWDGATGTANDAALAAAIAALPSPHGPYSQRVLYIPAGYFRLTSPATFFSPTGSLLGLRVIGEGDWVSQLIIDPAVAHGDGLRIQNGQGTRLEGFGLIGRTANPAGKMLTYTQTGGFGASNDHLLSHVKISSHDANLSYDTGITFDIGGGGNSEVTYFKTTVERFITNGVYLPGSQQKTHAFIECNFNGAWDGLDHTANGGLYGVRTAGGMFTWKGGANTAVRGACFYVGGSFDIPIVIDGCDSEICYQLLGDGAPGDIVNSAGSGNLRIINNRFSCVQNSNMDPDKIIGYGSGGTCIIDNNYFFNGDTNYPKIMFYFGSLPRGVAVTRNIFATRDSYLHDPITVLNATNTRPFIEVRDNIYLDSTGSTVTSAVRDETLNIPQSAAMFDTGSKAPIAPVSLWVALATFNAAAGHQDVELQPNMPEGITYDEVIGQLYNYMVVAGGIGVTMRVGVTPGGQELIKDFTPGGPGAGDSGAIYGHTAAQRGTDMPGVVGSGAMIGTSSVWVRLTAASGNLGDGVTSIITRGIIHLQLRTHLQMRFIT